MSDDYIDHYAAQFRAAGNRPRRARRATAFLLAAAAITAAAGGAVAATQRSADPFERRAPDRGEIERVAASFGVLRQPGRDPEAFGPEVSSAAQASFTRAGEAVVAHEVLAAGGLEAYVLESASTVCAFLATGAGSCAVDGPGLSALERGTIAESAGPAGGARWLLLLPDGTSGVTVQRGGDASPLEIVDNVVALETPPDGRPTAFAWTLADGTRQTRRVSAP